MYTICEEYVPDPPEEIRLVKELEQEYPCAPLFAEFRKARDWLSDHPKKRPRNLLRFLRNWVSNAAERNAKGQEVVGYEEIVKFVPVEKGG